MNKTEIIKMLEYSGMSYNNVQQNGLTDIIYHINDKCSDVCYQIRTYKDTLTIIFRGSDSKKDWNFNLDFCKKVIPYGNTKSKIKIHSGFLNAYKSKNVRNKIREFVTDKIKKIKLTGHSYGAALAIICAIDLQYNFSDIDYVVIVFGCPKVGNKYFVESYNRRIFKTLRVETPGDIVPKLPFAFMGYKHVGARLNIGQNHILNFIGVNNHSLQEYYSCIWDV